mmetsp:Transcript_24579/g.38141  ORF Transcript_24579/g.38141 Transcript_24579/m.38141 type:complete len:106 (-) Transcript_24579:748-1065(-)
MAKALHAIAEDLLFAAPFGQKMFKPSKLTLPKFKSLDVDLYFNQEHPDSSEVEEATKQAKTVAEQVLVDKMEALEPDQIIISHKFLRASNPLLVAKSDSSHVHIN